MKGGISMAEAKDSCVEPAKGPIVPATTNTQSSPIGEEGFKMIAKVGKPAPDFEAGFCRDFTGEYENRFTL